MKWLAISASLGTGLLYVLLLFPLGLFADLVVTRGAIPTFHNLSESQQIQFLKESKSIDEESWSARLRGAPELDKYSAEKIDAIMALPWDKLKNEKEKKARLAWETWWQEQWKERLNRIGVTVEQVGSERFMTLSKIGAGTLRPNSPDEEKQNRVVRQELAWRLFVVDYLTSNIGEDAAELYRERTRESIARIGVDLTLNRNVEELGVLGLALRMRQRWDAPVVAWLASVNSWMWAHGFRAYLIGILLIAVLIGVLRAGLMFLSSYAAALASGEAATRLRRAIYHHTYRLGTLAFRALGPTEAVGISTRHLEAVHDAMNIWLTVLYREPFKFILLFLLACLIDPWLALAFLMSALLVWMIGGQVAAYFRSQGRNATQKAAEQLALIQESIMLMRLVKAYLMELFNQARVERQLSKYYRAQLRQARGEAIYRPLLVLLGLLVAFSLLAVAGINVYHGQLGISSAVMLATSLVSLYLPLQIWLQNRRIFRRGKESTNIVFEFLDRTGSVGQVVEAEFLPPMSQQLEFDSVSFREPGTGRKLLEEVSLKIQAGQRVAIVGPEDIQKHALVYLIPRFLDPSSGEIRIDRRNLRWATLDSLRAQIAMVLQHNLVFNDTVANNIGCGDGSFTLPQIIEVAKIAHAHQFIQNLPKGYETPIGDLGHTLSIGEQFRVALARAILRDPAILIIEEPLSPLPEDVKDLLDDTMARVLPGRTVIFLPHRLSTIRHCDKVLLLYERKIVATGEHKELLANNDLYRHLQYLEFNEFTGYSGKAAPLSGIL
jgi:ATP-binding cassette subfamily B protein